MALTDVLHRLGQMIGLYGADEEVYDDEYEAYDDQEEQDWEDEEEEPARAVNYGRTTSTARSNSKPRNTRQDYDAPAQQRRPVRDNVVQMPSKGRNAQEARESEAPSRHSAIIMYVRRKEDGQQIISYVLEGRSVILNCEEIDDAQCQRVIDILSGAAFALGGRIQRVSHRNYLFVPASVEIVSGEPARYSEPYR